jgi:glycosyltransferase involved in cell wall biosynthesis
MKIGLISSTLPMVQGGGRFIVDWLAQKLVDANHSVETVWLPYTDEPDRIFSEMAAFRLLDLDSAFDRVITIRPPAHVVKHRNKIVWFIHHLRIFYDLWDTPYRSVPDNAYWRAFRKALITADTTALGEAKSVFSNSRVVGDRLRRFNGVDSEVLYPPIIKPEQFTNNGYGEEIVCVCRMEHHKRQHLLVEAMKYVKTPVRLRLAGPSMNSAYIDELVKETRGDLEDRVVIDPRWISEADKAEAISTALASAYVPFDEDSYGYPTIEAAHAAKATVTLNDGGGVSEFVIDGVNGFVTDPEPHALAEAFDRLWTDRDLARRMGASAKSRVSELGITWDHVLDRLLS